MRTSRFLAAVVVQQAKWCTGGSGTVVELRAELNTGGDEESHEVEPR